MTIQEAYTGWGSESEHVVVYNRTMNVFMRGFEMLDFGKRTSFYTKKDMATALAYSKLKKEEKPVAASIMYHVLIYAHEKDPVHQPAIDFSHEDLLGYEPVVPATDPVEPISVAAYKHDNVNPNDNVNSSMIQDSGFRIQKGQEPMAKSQSKAKPQPQTAFEQLLLNNKPLNKFNGVLDSGNSQPSAIRPQTSETQSTKNYMNRETNNFCRAAKAVKRIDPTTGRTVSAYESISDAQRKTCVKNIQRAIKTGGTAGGYKWEFVEGHDLNGNDNDNDNVNDNSSMIQDSGFRLQKGQEPTANSQSETQPSLSSFTDQEIIDEIKRRGWKGDISITMNIKL